MAARLLAAAFFWQNQLPERRCPPFSDDNE
jgi:hypothetical protein